MSGTERIENDGGRTLEEGQPDAGPAPEDPAQEEAQFDPEHARSTSTPSSGTTSERRWSGGPATGHPAFRRPRGVWVTVA